MANSEKKIFESFMKVKQDIIRLQSDINILSKNQEKIIDWMTQSNERNLELQKRIKELESKV